MESHPTTISKLRKRRNRSPSSRLIYHFMRGFSAGVRGTRERTIMGYQDGDEMQHAWFAGWKYGEQVWRNAEAEARLRYPPMAPPTDIPEGER